MNQNTNNIIKKLCKERFPNDVFQKGNSRVFLEDHGFYFTMIEFQPYSLKKGTFLNVGISFLFHKNDYLSFSYSYHNETRVGKKFIEYINDEQFENDVIAYVELAKEYILKYREFTDIGYAKQYFVNELDDRGWNSYIKAMFCFLADDLENGNRYYQMFMNGSFYKNIRDQYDTLQVTNKKDVLNMIYEQRKFWHGKASMKKMKVHKDYDEIKFS